MKTDCSLVPVPVGLLIGLLLIMIACGCREDITEQAMESDSNGYLCANGHRFYTARSVFADQCPKCKSIELAEVHGYVCEVAPVSARQTPGCGHATLAPRSGSKLGGGVQCERCKKPLSSVKLPSSKELAAWGAVKAKREEVMLK